MSKRKQISAGAFMASFSAAGRITPAPAPVAKSVVVERWNGQEWTETRLQWNGVQYAEVA